MLCEHLSFKLEAADVRARQPELGGLGQQVVVPDVQLAMAAAADADELVWVDLDRSAVRALRPSTTSCSVNAPRSAHASRGACVTGQVGEGWELTHILAV
jgi:hypothetical protein